MENARILWNATHISLESKHRSLVHNKRYGVRVKDIVGFLLGLLHSVVGEALSFLHGVSQILSEIRLSN